jgi:hypothetical protein
MKIKEKAKERRLPAGYRAVRETRTGIIVDGKLVDHDIPPVKPWDRFTIRVRIDTLACGHKKVFTSNFGWPQLRTSRRCDKCIEELGKKPLPLEKGILGK